jgi:hypothetical protein
LTGPRTRPENWPSSFSFRTEIGSAKLPLRFAAFTIDGLLMVLASVVCYWVAGLFGAWSFDAEWLNQYERNPNQWPGMPPLHVDLNAVFAVSVGIAVVLAVYATVCWARFGGLPGQRALSLRVVDYETGKRLSWAASAGRSVAVFGILGVVMVAYGLVSFYRLANYSVGDTTSDLIGPGSPLYRWADVITSVVFLGSAWTMFVFVSTTTNRARRGVQDRIAGSIVVSVRSVPLAWYPAGPISVAPVAWGWPGPPQGPAGSRPAPGWTPPGSWTPPGHPAPTDWNAAPGAPRPMPVPPAPLEGPESTPAPALEDTPWKGAAEPAVDSLAGRESAALGRRISAYLVDCLFVGVLFWAAFSTLLPDPSVTVTGPSERISIFAGLAGGAMQIVYFVLSWSYWRATPGQRLLRLAVVGETTGKALAPMDAFVRWAVLQGPFALATIVPLGAAPVVGVAAAAWAGFLLYSTQGDERGQGLHDHFVRTRVVTVQG